MTFDTIVAIVGFIGSIIAIYLAIRKSSHELDNIDSETIVNLTSTINEQERMYRELKKEFEDYKALTTGQIHDLVEENARLRAQLKRYTKGKSDAI